MSTESIQTLIPLAKPIVELDLGHLAPIEVMSPDTWVAFSFFDYRPSPPLPAPATLPDVSSPGEYHNPILPGFFPDPSICRVGDDYYLVNSSFALYPALPIFHSTDLIQWKPLGHVLDRHTQLRTLTNINATGGLYAPTIRFHKGRFFITCTMIGGGANFIVTADRPEGPWSDPVWTPSVQGIDPSPYFEDDKLFIAYNGDCPGTPLYEGHKALWLQQIDIGTGQPLSRPALLVNGGTDLSKKPIWIEGPHLFRRGDYYYLIAAEGGTGENHSVVVFRSKSITGPYDPAPHNPILTQRDLPENRSNKITCAGHADFVELPDGRWWAVFLACRPYEGNHFNTGRETFLLPVDWPAHDWPTILPPGQQIPIRAVAPFSDRRSPADLHAFHDDFDNPTLHPDWVTVRPRGERWFQLADGSLRLSPRPVRLDQCLAPSFAAFRQKHAHFTASTRLETSHKTEDCDAGIAAFQDEHHHLFFGARIRNGVCVELFAEIANGGPPTRIAQLPLPPDTNTIELSLCGEGGPHSLRFRSPQDKHSEWHYFALNLDGKVLSTHTAGGFQGVVIGLHSRRQAT